ncbi:hypothetical protein [Ruegeria atlantica]|uniref:hypothetical protein n=1 Tax=Ruegeria atlantica TaxID=81569 RepID=UPI00147CD190|nr:hypothetical protein [Ruegeria atlantica]
MLNFYEFYVSAFAVALPVLSVAVGMIGAMRSDLSANKIGIFLVIAGMLFGVWYAWALPLSLGGTFNVPATFGDPPVVLMFLFGASALIWVMAWWTPLGRQISEATPLSAIAAFQIPRVMGGLFLIGWWTGDIPAMFAFPAGLGDIWAGIASWKASRALQQSAPNAHRLLARAIAIGIADFILAVLLGIVTSEGFAHLFHHNAPNIINDHPLAFFPAYFVPIFLGFHFIAIARLLQERRAESCRHAKV